MSFRIQLEEAVGLAVKHEGLAAGIDEHSKTLVNTLDGGEGAEFILNSLAAIADAVGELSLLHTAAAVRLRTTVDEYRGIDEKAEEDFRALERRVP